MRLTAETRILAVTGIASQYAAMNGQERFIRLNPTPESTAFKLRWSAYREFFEECAPCPISGDWHYPARTRFERLAEYVGRQFMDVSAYVEYVAVRFDGDDTDPDRFADALRAGVVAVTEPPAHPVWGRVAAWRFRALWLTWGYGITRGRFDPPGHDAAYRMVQQTMPEWALGVLATETRGRLAAQSEESKIVIAPKWMR